MSKWNKKKALLYLNTLIADIAILERCKRHSTEHMR